MLLRGGSLCCTPSAAYPVARPAGNFMIMDIRERVKNPQRRSNGEAPETCLYTPPHSEVSPSPQKKRNFEIVGSRGREFQNCWVVRHISRSLTTGEVSKEGVLTISRPGKGVAGIYIPCNTYNPDKVWRGIPWAAYHPDKAWIRSLQGVTPRKVPKRVAEWLRV